MGVETVAGGLVKVNRNGNSQSSVQPLSGLGWTPLASSRKTLAKRSGELLRFPWDLCSGPRLSSLLRERRREIASLLLCLGLWQLLSKALQEGCGFC